MFIFNDNESQSRAFLTRVTEGRLTLSSPVCQAGGGNAVIRPYQCRVPRRAVGVPTGPGYSSLTAHAKSQIDHAIAYVSTLFEADARITEVIYSASQHDPRELGHGIFDVGTDVLRYIPTALEQVVNQVDRK